MIQKASCIDEAIDNIWLAIDKVSATRNSCRLYNDLFYQIYHNLDYVNSKHTGVINRKLFGFLGDFVIGFERVFTPFDFMHGRFHLIKYQAIIETPEIQDDDTNCILIFADRKLVPKQAYRYLRHSGMPNHKMGSSINIDLSYEYRGILT